MDPTPDPAPRPARFELLRAWWRGAPGVALRWAFAVLPFLWLGQRVSWRTLGARVLEVGLAPLAHCAFWILAAFAVAALRWGRLLRAYARPGAERPPFLTLYRHVLVAQYYALLPSGMVGDVVRGARVASCLPSLATSYLVLLLDRLAALLGLALLASAAALALPPVGSLGGLLRVALPAIAAPVLALFVLPTFLRRNGLEARAAALPWVGRHLQRLPAAEGYGTLVEATACSVGAQLCAIASVAALLGPIAQRGPWATVTDALRVVPAIILATFIPLTPAALGQRELFFVTFYGMVGVGAPEALAGSLLHFGTLVLVSLLGLPVLLWERHNTTP
ncbi:MAG: flippase-like domain-containing protein [Deltaproteobacteria bacterium]|nr:flippase-like domain-containing protein [Deltaproteobacteria bacterium]